ncbi:MAG: endonuclease MutS2 [Planctomycetota bacterium]
MNESRGSRSQRSGRSRIPKRNQKRDSDKQSVLSSAMRRLELDQVLQLLSLHATTSTGRQRLLSLSPQDSAEQMRRGLAVVGEISTLLEKGFDPGLRGIGNLGSILQRAGDGTSLLDGPQLANVSKVLDRSRALRGVLAECALPHLVERSQRLTDLPALREKLDRAVDFSGEILDEATEALLDLRMQAGELEREIREWLESHRDLSPWKKFLQGSVITPRNGRLCWAVRVECRHQVRGVIHGESASGQTLFVEPEPVVRKGHQLQRIQDRILQEKRRIIADLSREVWLKSTQVVQLWDQLIELDMIQAKARFAKNLGCRIPEISEDRALRFVQARHPLLIWRHLQEQGNPVPLPEVVPVEKLQSALDEIVPLDLDLNAGQFQLVVTGPNTGGKTVVLKTAGLLSLMASCSIPVPAVEGTTIPCFDAVHVDIGDEQSLEQDLSTFSSHVAIISEILEFSTSKSLVLLDELGSGTDPLEGAALAESVLDRLYERGSFTVVTTHIGRLKEYAYRRKKCENAAMEFDPEKLAPTYRLKIGLPGKSNALVIAEKLGLPEEVISKARELSQKETGIDPEVLEGLRRSQSDLERKVQEAEAQGEKARLMAEEVEASGQEQQKLRSALEYELERIEETRVREVIDQVQEQLTLLGDLQGEKGDAVRELKKRLERSRADTRLQQRRLETARSLRKGDAVFVPRLQKVCEIKKINKEKQKLVVVLNGIDTEVQFQEISWVLPPPGFDLWWYCDE